MRRTRNPQETTVLPAQTPHQGQASQPAPASQPGGPNGANPWGSSRAAGIPAGLPAAQLAPEEIVVRVRRHGRHLALPVALLFVVAGLGGFFIGTLPEPWQNLLAAAGGLLLVIFGAIGPILGWLARRVVVTTRRVIVHHGFFVRHRTEVSLARVREVRSKQNPIQRMWGSGDIDLYVGAEATRIHDAPGLNALHAALQELTERSYDEQARVGGFAGGQGW